MKKLLAIALLLLTVLTAGAQGTWRVSHREADPMKGQDARDVYIYNAPGIGAYHGEGDVQDMDVFRHSISAC